MRFSPLDISFSLIGAKTIPVIYAAAQSDTCCIEIKLGVSNKVSKKLNDLRNKASFLLLLGSMVFILLLTSYPVRFENFLNYYVPLFWRKIELLRFDRKNKRNGIFSAKFETLKKALKTHPEKH